MIDYPCTEFDDLSFSHFGFIVRTSTQTESEVECRTITMLQMNNQYQPEDRNLQHHTDCLRPETRH